MFEFVKQQTADNHASLEKYFISEIRKLTSETDYAKFLSRLYRFYAPLEKQINRFVDEGIIDDIHERRTASWLLEDMKALNFVPQDTNLAEISFIEGLPEALGALYVMEGSTHGGPYIAKMILNNLKITVPAFRYFNGYNDNTADKWSHFKSTVSKHSGIIDHEMMAAGANQTFMALQNWLQNKHE